MDIFCVFRRATLRVRVLWRPAVVYFAVVCFALSQCLLAIADRHRLSAHIDWRPPWAQQTGSVNRFWPLTIRSAAFVRFQKSRTEPLICSDFLVFLLWIIWNQSKKNPESQTDLGCRKECPDRMAKRIRPKTFVPRAEFVLTHNTILAVFRDISRFGQVFNRAVCFFWSTTPFGMERKLRVDFSG